MPDNQRATAHEAFQSIAFAHAILSDPARRKRYDATGSTADSIVDADGFNWSDYYREQYQDAISADAIQKFAEQYKGSDEERDDILIAYEQCEGDMDQLYETVLLSSVTEDDERFRRIIDEAVASEDVPAFPAYTKEANKKRQSRLKRAQAEAEDAEEFARELGVHDKLFGSRKAGKKSKGSSEAELAALISKRQQDRSTAFLDRLAAKYGAAEGKARRKGQKRVGLEDEEPSEEAFQAAAARLRGGAMSDPGRSKKSRR